MSYEILLGKNYQTFWAEVGSGNNGDRSTGLGIKDDEVSVKTPIYFGTRSSFCVTECICCPDCPIWLAVNNGDGVNKGPKFEPEYEDVEYGPDWTGMTCFGSETALPTMLTSFRYESW